MEKAKKTQNKTINYAPADEVMAEVEKIIAANKRLMKKLAKM